MIRRRSTTECARGFTLVELLIVIAILALLSSMVLFGMAGATQQAKANRTKAQIARLHELIMEEWEQYETRRPPIVRVAGEGSVSFAQRRLNALRELMRLELPDRKSDVQVPPGILDAPPAKMRAFDRFVLGHAGSYDSWSIEHQGAECLYMIIKRIPVGDGTALQFFAEKEIGDFDLDGMPEILDAWGNPISFVRWAPGYSRVYLGLWPPESGDPDDYSGQSPIQSGDPRLQPDPFDLSGRGDPRNNPKFDNDPANDTFALFPLIYSSGPDGLSNIREDSDEAPLIYRGTRLTPYDSVVPSDPYVLVPAQDKTGNAYRSWLGSVKDPQDAGQNIDNLTNHWISTSIN